MKLRAATLWVAFLAAHWLVAWLGWVYPNQPMGDVVLVYDPWSSAALGGGAVVGITESWVYPQLALLPMLFAQVIAVPLSVFWSAGAYLIAWAVLVTALDAMAFAVLVGRSGSAPRRAAGWFWTTAMLLMGPIAMYRIDAIAVPLAVVGGLWLVRRPVLGAALLAVGAWIKIWPGALLLAAVVALRGRLRVVLAAVAVTGGVILVLLLLGADRHLLGFLTAQTGRGLQIEAVAATPFMWMANAGTASIAYSYEMLTFQIGAPGADAVSVLLTPLMVLAVLGVAALGAGKAVRGASFTRLFPPLALALVVSLIVTNKVGSPQFQTWLLAPIILWILLDRTRARVPAVMTLVLCGLTCLVYPLMYGDLLRAEHLAVLLLSARNVLLVALLAVSIAAILRVPTRVRHSNTH